jgi:hypothetical protein
VSIRVVLYPITSGAVQAISHICIQGAIQSVADGARSSCNERLEMAPVLPQSLRAMPRPWSHSQSTSQSRGM